MIQRPETNTTVRALIAAVVLCLGVIVGVVQLTTPAPVGADAPAEAKFSAERALSTVEMIAGNGLAHGVGDTDHTRVKEGLVREIRDIGYEPIVEQNSLTTQWVSQTKTIDVYADELSTPVSTTDTSNIIVRVPGSDSGSSEAVLVSAHYDSVPPGPGASDDASQAAAMVEVMRALKASPPLKHDVLFLFTDAEELAMRGSRAFVVTSPLAADVEFILNFEYRGTTGKPLFFEGAYVDSDLIGVYREASSAPLASSMFFFAYQQLENNTDFSVLQSLDKPGLAFAPVGNNVRYHTPSDDLINFSPGALQDSGDVMLGMVRGLADQPSLEAGSDVELTWFNIGPVLFSYTTPIAYALLALGVVLWILALVFGVRRDLVTGRAVARGLGTTVLAALVAMVVAQVLLLLIYWLRWDTRDFIGLKLISDTDPYRGQLYMVTMVVAASAAIIGLLIWARKRHQVEGLQLGALLVWGLLALLTVILAAPVAYLFTIPLLLLSAALLVRMLVKTTWVVFAVDLVASFVFVVFIFPVGALIYQGLSVSAGALVAFLMAISLCVLLPVLDPIAKALGGLLPLIAVGAAAVMFAIGVATPLVNANHKQPDSIVYVVDADTETAQWYSNDEEPDEWTASVLGANPDRVPAPAPLLGYFRNKAGLDQTVLSAAADEAQDLEPPGLTVESDTTKADRRLIRFKIASDREAPNLWYTMTTDGDFGDLKINGDELTVSPASTWSNIGYGVPAEGYDVELSVPAGATVEVVATDQTSGIADDVGLPPRPDWTMSWWPRGKQADATLVTKTYTL